MSYRWPVAESFKTSLPSHVCLSHAKNIVIDRDLNSLAVQTPAFRPQGAFWAKPKTVTAAREGMSNPSLAKSATVGRDLVVWI